MVGTCRHCELGSPRCCWVFEVFFLDDADRRLRGQLIYELVSRYCAHGSRKHGHRESSASVGDSASPVGHCIETRVVGYVTGPSASCLDGSLDLGVRDRSELEFGRWIWACGGHCGARREKECAVELSAFFVVCIQCPLPPICANDPDRRDACAATVCRPTLDILFSRS